jgi:hypothetical protein
MVVEKADVDGPGKWLGDWPIARRWPGAVSVAGYVHEIHPGALLARIVEPTGVKVIGRGIGGRRPGDNPSAVVLGFMADCTLCRFR